MSSRVNVFALMFENGKKRDCSYEIKVQNTRFYGHEGSCTKSHFRDQNRTIVLGTRALYQWPRSLMINKSTKL